VRQERGCQPTTLPFSLRAGKVLVMIMTGEEGSSYGKTFLVRSQYSTLQFFFVSCMYDYLLYYYFLHNVVVTLLV